jgi:hypothetical protein
VSLRRDARCNPSNHRRSSLKWPIKPNSFHFLYRCLSTLVFSSGSFLQPQPQLRLVLAVPYMSVGPEGDPLAAFRANPLYNEAPSLATQHAHEHGPRHAHSSQSLPAYSRRPHSSHASRSHRSRPLTEHEFYLSNSKKSPPWVTLKVLSCAGNSKIPPTFVEGDKITGEVLFDLEGGDHITAVDISVSEFCER